VRGPGGGGGGGDTYLLGKVGGDPLIATVF